MAGSIERPGAERWVPDHPTLGSLKRAAPSCRGCELWEDATHVVFSSGPAHPHLVLVGEQPGDQEDRAGEPFVGPAGRVLADALAAADIDPSTVYLTNAVKHFRHRTVGKRRIHEKPGVAHVAACHPWLAAELDVAEPAVVVCLGVTAARAVLGRDARIGAERGRVLKAPAGVSAGAVIVTTHPSAVLRMRGKEGWDEAFDAFVSDLETARDVAHR